MTSDIPNMNEQSGEKLEQLYEHETLQGIRELANQGYNPRFFLEMIGRYGVLEASKRLLVPPIEHASDGFTRLWEMGRLDMSVEYAAAYDERFAPLFTDEERELARQRLARYDFRPPAR